MGDDASLASQRSGLSTSLLERIRAQREREAGTVSTTSAPFIEAPPVYSPSGNSWLPSFRGFGNNPEASVSLLGPEEGGEGYSMTRYFQTFVQDVYNGFRSLHPVLQFVIVLILLFVAFKLVIEL